jgi:hypothetical protein
LIAAASNQVSELEERVRKNRPAWAMGGWELNELHRQIRANVADLSGTNCIKIRMTYDRSASGADYARDMKTALTWTNGLFTVEVVDMCDDWPGKQHDSEMPEEGLTVHYLGTIPDGMSDFWFLTNTFYQVRMRFNVHTNILNYFRGNGLLLIVGKKPFGAP